MTNVLRKCDEKFGDIVLFDVTPNDFISLIKYATFVFTDSFHACVFSNIYSTPYVVFDRQFEGRSMSSRIDDLLSLYNSQNRFIKSLENINDCLENVKKCAIVESEELKQLRLESFSFLENALFDRGENNESKN